MCAPPLLLLQTMHGILSFLNFLSKERWSIGYVSISNAPNLQLFSSLIGIEPTPSPPLR